jgi:putative ABC transport system permease protein
MSLEDGIATTLGIKLGDNLTWDFVGTRLDARVTSLRKVAWDSFRVNFFALFPPGVLDAMPTTYISAVRVAEGKPAWLTPLLREFPNVGDRRRRSLHQCRTSSGGRACGGIRVPFTLLGGVLVLEAAIAVTQDERRYDAAILRTLGAARAQRRAARRISRARRAGGTARRRGATIVGYVLSDRAFQIPFTGIRGSGSSGSVVQRWVSRSPDGSNARRCASRRSSCSGS